MESKYELRKIFKARRKSLSVEEREILSLSIADSVLKYINEHQNMQVIHIFLPIKKLNEVNTYPLVEKLIKNDIHVLTSATDFTTKEMKTLELKLPLETVEDEYGIPVPIDHVITENMAIDMVLIPLLAYDLEGNRLGYGMGFYDKFLETVPKPVIKAGVSFFLPERNIPYEAHDIKLDICFTGREVYKF